jgi:hypothetical protein
MIKTLVGYIVNDDYSDPVGSEYRIYDCKEEARKAAKYRLKCILKGEEKMKEYKKLIQDLEDFDHVCIQNLSGGWAGNIAKISVAEVFKW